MHSRIFWAACLAAIPAAYSLSFVVDTPTPSQCDDIGISWSGGQGPFQILFTPVFGVPRNFSVSGSASGRFRTQLPFPSGSKFLVTMFDPTGFESGVTIPQPLVVGPSAGGSCNATTGGVAFTFSLDAALRQCRSYPFSGYDGAVQPVTILGIIPGGETFVLRPPTQTNATYEWVANVASGTSILFVMFDSQGRQGGSSSVLTVLPSDDSSCLGASSPSSTSILPTTTRRPGSSSPSPSSTAALSAGVIAGTVLGGLVLLAAFIALGLFLLRRFARKNETHANYGNSRISQRFSLHTRYDSEFDTPPPPSGHPRQSIGQHPYALRPGVPFSPDSVSTQHLLQEQYTPTPFILNPPSQAYSSYPGTSIPDSSVSADQSDITSPPLTSAQRKSAMAIGSKSSAPPRFILHTDVEEIAPNQDGVIELPPQYSATRTPLQPNVFAPPLLPQGQAPASYAPN